MVLNISEVGKDARQSFKGFSTTRSCIDRGGKDKGLVESLAWSSATMEN